MFWCKRFVNKSSFKKFTVFFLVSGFPNLRLGTDCDLEFSQVMIRYTMDGWKTFSEVPALFSHRIFATDDIDAFVFVLNVAQVNK